MTPLLLTAWLSAVPCAPAERPLVLRGVDRTFAISGTRVFTGRGAALTELRVMGEGLSLSGMRTILIDLEGRWLTLELHGGINANVPPALRLGRQRLETLENVKELPSSTRFSCFEAPRADGWNWL